MKTCLQTTVRSALASRWVGKRKSALALLPETAVLCLARLEVLTRGLERAHRVSLPRQALLSLEEVKGFCGGILDPSVSHAWRTTFRKLRLSLRVRLAIASSVFLFRKVVPQPKRTKAEVAQLVSDYVDKMTAPQELPPADFLLFAREQTELLFRPGWDKSWWSRLDSFTLPTASCLEGGRKDGGARGWGLDGDPRTEFDQFTCGVRTDVPLDCKVIGVETGGKLRLVTKFSARRSYLKPLHSIIYDHLSKKSWLLRGEADPGRFDEFSRREGEIFVSGDYESASDNLNMYLSRYILGVLKRTSTEVPENVWDTAIACQTNVICGRQQGRGQLMGSLLCFPLLCLVNYISFKWAIRREVPVKINGDDIVFRCTPQEADRWFSTVSTSGLTVSRGKTVRSRSWFSLNSSFFLSTDGIPTVVPFVRSTALFGAAECLSEVAGRLGSVTKGKGFLRDWCHQIVLREMSSQVRRAQRSVRRGLGASISWSALRKAGFFHWEAFYTSLPVEPAVPLTFSDWHQNLIPENYERVVSEKPDDPQFYQELVERSWFVKPLLRKGEKKGYWDRVREGTFSYVHPNFEKFARLSRISLAEAKQLLSSRVNFPRVSGNLSWQKKVVSFRSGFVSPMWDTAEEPSTREEE